MTLMNQPRPAPARVANPAPPRDRETMRLLRLWAELTYRAASAAAHRTGEESQFFDLQQQVEDEITDRVPDSESLLAERWAWEATLIHQADTPAKDCLVCRRASRELPAGGPVPAGLGGAS